MKLIDKIKTKWNEHKYNKYIEEHRENMDRAFYDMVMNPNLYWVGWNEEFCWKLKQRVDKHDLSKYSEEEYDAYRKYYHPINEEEKEKAKIYFDGAWKHHYENNRHHWQARMNDKDDEMNEEIALDCLENILDWMAMGYKFKNNAYQYYQQNKDKIILPKKQREYMEKILNSLNQKGVK